MDLRTQRVIGSISVTLVVLAVIALQLFWPQSLRAEAAVEMPTGPTIVADTSDGVDPSVPVAAVLLLTTGAGIALARMRRPDEDDRPPSTYYRSATELLSPGSPIPPRPPSNPTDAEAEYVEVETMPEVTPRTIYVDDAITVTATDDSYSVSFNPKPEPMLDPDEIALAPHEVLVEEDDDPIAADAVLELEDATQSGSHLREIDLHETPTETNFARSLEKIRLVEQAATGLKGPVLDREEFARHLHTEFSRHQRGGNDGVVASLMLSELTAVRLRLGNRPAAELFQEVTAVVRELCRPLDIVGMVGPDQLAVLMPDCDEATGEAALESIANQIATMTFTSLGERVLLTPATGYALLSDTGSTPDLVQAVEHARSMSMLNQHLRPERWDVEAEPHASEEKKDSWRARIGAKVRTPLQILATFVLAWVLPFLVYIGMDSIGFDISFIAYLFFVLALTVTGGFILAEGLMAMRQKEPPAVPSEPYPRASALIAAYLPNEAATVIETIESFLALDYPNDIQIILAYNTPERLPVEDHLDRLAEEHPNFFPVRVVGSNSKAQNVNATLTMADGKFIGMFDADHQPRPDAYTRAWRWIDAGYDVVQGHCLTRNGDANWLAKMVAVEFESIYAVAHPGRAKMHRFGVFGGSNGFWRRELLHETRMRGSMLTEDIDSSMRVIERGFKIRSDRDLVSRELATTTFRQLWNQRMRWAQGWFQVSLRHVGEAFRSKDLTLRQKAGVFHLLMWREVYPWLSQQLFPLFAFWAVKAGGLDRLNWTVPIFVATSIFTLSVGPLQTLFAYKLADPEIKKHKSWFWGYLFFASPFYTEYKNLIARVAQVKELMGESDWRVTPRSADPV